MTRERTKLLGPVLKAWADGGEIQKRISGLMRWEDFRGADPEFEDATYEWRIKPSPRKIWINEYRIHGRPDETRFGYAHLTQEAAEESADTDSHHFIRTHEITLSE